MKKPARKMTPNDFIKQRPYLIWYTKNYEGLSRASIVEATLNYGDWEDVQKLIKIMGIKAVAQIFRENSDRARSNYDKKIAHFFRLYFNRHA